MARDITSGFQTEIEAKVLSPIILVKAEFDSGTLRFWSGYGEITFNGEVYTGSGDLLQMTSIEETQGLVANNVSFELSGIPSSLLAIALIEDYRNKPITAWFGTLDNAGAIINAPYELFSGVIDTMPTANDGDTGVITVNAESELLIMNESGERRYTDEDQKTDYEDDLGFEFVSILQDIELAFGAGRLD